MMPVNLHEMIGLFTLPPLQDRHNALHRPVETSYQPVLPLRFEKDLDTILYDVPYLRFFASGAVTQIELHFRPPRLLSANFYPPSFLTGRNEAVRCHYFSVAVLPEQSQSVLFSVLVWSHSQPCPSSEEGHIPICKTTHPL